MKRSPKLDVRADHLKVVSDILRKLVPAQDVWAFGSRVKGTAKKFSDLDLAIISDKPISLEISASLSDSFSECDLPYKVDVVDWATTSEAFRKIIEQNKVVILKGDVSPLVSAPRGGASTTPLSGGHPRNAPEDKPEFTFDLPIQSVWPTIEIGKVAEIYDGPHATPVKTDTGPVFLGINSLDKGRLNLSNIEHLSEHDFLRWTRRVEPIAGDFVFSYETRLGDAAIIPVDLRCCLGRRMALARCNPKQLNSRFLLYQYLSPTFQSFIKSRTIHGSTVDRLSLTEFPIFPILLPPINIQEAIAHILGSLDEKIENNRRMNETLEAMTRALFKDWFVDFGPVRAKMEGREPPGLTAEVAGLFPDALGENEKPQGWAERPLSESINIIGGGTPKTSESAYWDGDIPWFSVVDAPDSADSFVIETQKHITDAGLRNCSSRLLDEGVTIISARGTVGKLAIVGKPMAMNQSCYGIESSNGRCPYFTYFLLKNALEGLKANTHGSVFDTITRLTFDSVAVPNPSMGLRVEFDSNVTPWMSRIKNNLNENTILESTRDLLLPKLLSGEIRIHQAEQLIRAAV